MQQRNRGYRQTALRGFQIKPQISDCPRDWKVKVGSRATVKMY